MRPAALAVLVASLSIARTAAVAQDSSSERPTLPPEAFDEVTPWRPAQERQAMSRLNRRVGPRRFEGPLGAAIVMPDGAVCRVKKSGALKKVDASTDTHTLLTRLCGDGYALITPENP